VGCNVAGQCSAAPDAALAQGTAEWQVQSWTSDGFGPWSAVIALTVAVSMPPPPTLISPVGAVGSASPTLEWNGSTDAAVYYVVAYDVAGLRVDRWLTPAQAGCASGGICSLAGVTFARGPAQWRVIAWSQSGYSPWSSTMLFVVP
jgi:hypothetical protein